MAKHMTRGYRLPEPMPVRALRSPGLPLTTTSLMNGTIERVGTA